MFDLDFDFGLGERVDELRAAVREFAQRRIAPRAAEIDHSNVFPRDLWPELGAMGLLGLTVEEDYGGLGYGYLEHVVAMEESQPRLGLGGPLLRCALQPVREPDPPLGQRGAAAPIPAEADLGRAPRRPCDE
jgi:alkylation response protein AidB-like acyl-CoA dehydrogenase